MRSNVAALHRAVVQTRRRLQRLIRGAYVVGVRDAARGEVIVAFVDVLRPVSERNLCDHVKDRAATFKTPHHVVFRREDQLPRLASGKVSKYRLQEEAARELGL